MLKYSVSIKWSDEDEGFVAVIPELPGLSAFGETQEKAIKELKIAEEAYLETLKKYRETIPAPEKLVHHSGQIRVRMPKTLHAKLAAAAESEGISLNTYIVSLLSEREGQKEIVKQLSKTQKTLLYVPHQGSETTYQQKQKQEAVPSSESQFMGRFH